MSMLIDKLKRLEAEHGKARLRAKSLPVYYGWAKINKIQKREALTVIFLNDIPGPRQTKDGYDGVTRWIEPVYKRWQTEAEMSDADHVNRMYTSFSVYMDDKRFGGSLEAVLEYNSEADKNHVSETERKKIQELLRTSYISHHITYKEPKVRELSLFGP